MKRIMILMMVILTCQYLNAQQKGHYENFTVSVYARAYEVNNMKDISMLDSIWNVITRQVKVDKIYLETHRDQLIVDDEAIQAAKAYFEDHGVKVAGGITYTINERNRFETFCYTNPEHREKVKEIAEFTAMHFDEFILDDFFYTSCKCDLCIAAKGSLSWTQFRINLMRDAARDLVINPAKAVNPAVKVIIKYPNWYEHFQGLGFNLEVQPKMFDGIYTGTETRDPVATTQHLQQYESYLIFRYFENIIPGKNGGGWVDAGAIFYLDRYAEQLWLTSFAKAPEITLFDFRQLQRGISPSVRAEWQDMQTSFNFDEMMKTAYLENEIKDLSVTFAGAAGYALEQVDDFLGNLGNPIGIESYRPYHAVGEDFLQNYLGMIGIPMEIVPEFPEDPQMIILTESAKYDPMIIQKIKDRLTEGKNVLITSGFLKAMQGRGIEDIVELRFNERKVLVKDFTTGFFGNYSSDVEILIPQINYLTNDSWEDISGVKGTSGWPVLHMAQYSKGFLYVLTIPDNFSDLYNLPPEVLNRIRAMVTQDIGYRIEGPSQVSLFIYDNGTCIVESFLPEVVTVKLIVNQSNIRLQDILTSEEIEGVDGMSPVIWGRERTSISSFEFELKPHSYKVFRTLGE